MGLPCGEGYTSQGVQGPLCRTVQITHVSPEAALGAHLHDVSRQKSTADRHQPGCFSDQTLHLLVSTPQQLLYAPAVAVNTAGSRGQQVGLSTQHGVCCVSAPPTDPQHAQPPVETDPGEPWMLTAKQNSSTQAALLVMAAIL